MREGLIPTVLGTGVAATGIALKTMAMRDDDMDMSDRMDRDKLMPLVAAGVIGFGLAHVVLGSIDMVQDNK
ncbi:asparagine synthase [Serpentinicella sp. ANB-PHB4]|uniref:asparagine synthase n=1 Tax=Serpentinicella sp. ANB-PHB4 TaxID=3074076 RepID=UPI002861FAEC|nr:asparagine synthase [Serpentinicella sp. ANB-PHB4]MDR5658520.1 asparagine synthase [Serpentinicella sp. ANB-PHB4]